MANQATASGLKLHLGCAGTVVEGWENLDKSPSVYLARFPVLRRALLRARVLTEEQAAGFPPGVVHADVSRRVPYPDGSAAYAYSSHLIEHMARWQALNFVGECRRVLAPGGIMRTATPDLARLVRKYTAGGSDGGTDGTAADAFMAELGMFHQIPANPVRRLIRRQFSASAHQWLYDAESLTALLLEGGMVDAEVREYRVGQTPDLELLEHRPDSLFVEARRP